MAGLAVAQRQADQPGAVALAGRSAAQARGVGQAHHQILEVAALRGLEQRVSVEQRMVVGQVGEDLHGAARHRQADLGERAHKLLGLQHRPQVGMAGEAQGREGAAHRLAEQDVLADARLMVVAGRVERLDQALGPLGGQRRPHGPAGGDDRRREPRLARRVEAAGQAAGVDEAVEPGEPADPDQRDVVGGARRVGAVEQVLPRASPRSGSPPRPRRRCAGRAPRRRSRAGRSPHR